VDELTGRILHHRYKIQSQLGKKTGRRTLLAVDLTTEVQVVIKLLIFDRDFDWQDLKLFEREAETLKSLDLPAIPRYLDYFEFDLLEYRGFALVQTYIDAQSLDLATSAGRRWSEDELKQIAQALLTILNYLHSQNPPVIHRDLKPSNILIANRSSHHVGDIYLVDFGSVQNLGHRDGGTMTIVGTYGYMPPEQFGGKAFPASDLYSLGATLIYLVTGKHPADLTQDDGKIHFTSDYIDSGFFYWLNYLTEPTLKNRCPNVAEAQSSLSTSTLMYPNIRSRSIGRNQQPNSTFIYAIIKTIGASFMTGVSMFFVIPLALMLSSFSVPGELIAVTIIVSLLLIFASILYVLD
jgi:serine/threonine protein kinase